MNTLKRRFYFRNVSQIKNSEDKTLEFQRFKEKAEKEEKIVDVGTRVATYKSVKENMVTKKD